MRARASMTRARFSRARARVGYHRPIAMKQSAIHDIMSGRRRGPLPALLRALLAAASVPYALTVSVRRRLRRWGLPRPRRAPVGVICVGNLTTGGTGKTPMVAWTVARLR